MVQTFARFYISLFSFVFSPLLPSCRNSSCVLDQVSYQRSDLQVLPPALGVVFLASLVVCFEAQKFFILKSSVSTFFKRKMYVFLVFSVMFLAFSLMWKNPRPNPVPVSPANTGSHA